MAKYVSFYAQLGGSHTAIMSKTERNGQHGRLNSMEFCFLGGECAFTFIGNT